MAIAAVAIFAVLGGIAYASIPDAAGVIHGCYRTSMDDQKGQLRVVEDPANCRTNEQPIEWNQRGAAGPPGPAGQDGADGADGQGGADGVSPTVTQLAVGDVNCPAGGAAITDAAGTTAYVCGGANGDDGADGEPFSGTFTSPNGEYTISVTDNGISLASPGALIDVAGTAITVQAAGALDVAAGTTLGLTSGGGTAFSAGSSFDVNAGSSMALSAGSALAVSAGNAFTVSAGGSATLQSATAFSLRGSVVNINRGTPCERAAREGDTVDPVRFTIDSGASTVCIG
jgi:hypothetical protein